MAKNGARGSGRVGREGRSPAYDPKTPLWTKRDTTSGRFAQAKKNGGTFRGVRKEQ